MNIFMNLFIISSIFVTTSMTFLCGMNQNIDSNQQKDVKDNPYAILGKTFVTLPTLEVLQQRFKDADLEDFAENATLLSDCASKKFSLQGLALTVNLSLFNYLQTISETINEAILEDEIIEVCLTDNPEESKLLLEKLAIERKRVQEEKNKNLKK